MFPSDFYQYRPPNPTLCDATVFYTLKDQKKLQGQLIAEQEALYGSKPSPSKPLGGKKAPRMSTGGATNRRLSLGAAMHQTPKPNKKADHRQNDGALSNGNNVF